MEKGKDKSDDNEIHIKNGETEITLDKEEVSITASVIDLGMVNIINIGSSMVAKKK